MSRASERRRQALEALYSERLLSALRRCADGRWGLFGHNDASIDGHFGAWARARLRDPSKIELLDLGAKIGNLRRSLGYREVFPLHQRLVRMQSSHEANTPGEPKFAQHWLDEMMPPRNLQPTEE